MRETGENAVVLAPQPGGLMLVDREDITLARHNWGRWIVDCGSQFCTSALQLVPGTPIMRCWDCGWVTEQIVWPDAADMIETILMMRPLEWTRNWEPGETVADLIAENLQHGIIRPPADLDDPAGTRVLIRATAADGAHLRRVRLHRREIGA